MNQIPKFLLKGIFFCIFLFVISCSESINDWHNEKNADEILLKENHYLRGGKTVYAQTAFENTANKIDESKAFARASNYLGDKGKELLHITSNNGFIFFTDTHENANDKNTAKIINLALTNTPIDKVFWGGDAISAYGTKDDLDEQWAAQKKIFASLNADAKLFIVRGNHDFTIKKSSKESIGYTYSQEDAFNMINDVMERNVIRNAEDPFGTYYYFDDNSNKIRFIVVASYSNSDAGEIPWKVNEKVQKTQLDWIANTAVLTTPLGFNIIFIMHAPVIDAIVYGEKNFNNLSMLIAAVAKKESFFIDNTAYDFSSLKDVNVLMVLSGHLHHDMQTFQDGVLHVLTASDAHFSDYSRDPFSVMTGRRKGYLQHAVDVFSINLSNNIISTVRIGVGGNRFFHLTQFDIAVGESVSFLTSLNGYIKWYSYNALKNQYKDGKWTLFNDIISVSEYGCVTGVGTGEAVLIAQDELGNKEIFDIMVH